MAKLIPAQVFPPGDFIRDEMEARRWTQDDLAEVMGRPRRLVNELLAAKKAITPDTAHDLADAFGTSPDVWMNLESAYRLSLVARDSNDVKKRAELFQKAPVADIAKRRWIRKTENVDELESELKRFYEVSSLDQSTRFCMAARKSATYAITTNEQRAWACRVKHLAETISVARFDLKSFDQGLEELRHFITHEADIRRVPRLLADLGVRFVIVEHLPKSKIDGITLWIDDNKPVVGMSVRYDRIDNFWFTLRHELAHVRHRDTSIDEGLAGDDCVATDQKPEYEQRADQEAAEFLVPTHELEDFIKRTKPLYYRSRVVQFANRIRVHPGIIVGQLQRKKNSGFTYSQLRDLLVKVRITITQNALTDGWGFTPTIF